VLRIDHVVYATSDLHRAGERFLDELGLASVPGGTHPGWGTANRIVPLGTAYVELLAVVDPGVAQADPIGRSQSMPTACNSKTARYHALSPTPSPSAISPSLGGRPSFNSSAR